ncbi:MAG: ABC transporter ATP-binding protein [Actinobacteria bacterium]|nr:ABC transporter ATP-binding protein [Actinomycetota bacterium]
MRGFIRPYRRVLAVGGLLAALEVVVGLAQPWPLKWVVDELLADDATASDHPKTLLAMACLGLVAIVATTAVLGYWATRILSSAGLHLANGIRETVFAHLNRLSLRYHGANRVGDLSARVTGDVDRTQDMIVQLLSVLVPNVMMLVGMVVVLFVLDPMFALLALAVTPVLAITVRSLTSRLKDAERRSRKADGQVAAATSETLGAIHFVQAYSLEPHQQDRFDRLSRTSLDAGLEAVRLQARFSPVVDITSVLSTVAIMWFGAIRVMDGKLSVGELLVFLSYVGSVYKPIRALAKLGRTRSKGLAAAERVMAVLAEEPQIVDAPNAVLAPRLSGAIDLHEVSFSYGREPVLSAVDLHIESGETVALVGPTGAGKSTIASLVPRLIDPTTGWVALDGIDVRSMTLASLRSQVSTVLQDCVLLHGTLRDNIAAGRPWASASDIDRAAKLALVDEFACRLPDGLDTMITERGANLSGGQRQRISIARAILRDAPILILDEPTSALDTESEELIVQALSNLPNHRTTLVIAHRLSTVRSADRIVVLEGGVIVQQGTHHDLLGVEGRYRRLHAKGLALSAPAAAS